eukprot:scaffold186177_cov19-Tisochrysis_lutea.AAC.1
MATAISSLEAYLETMSKGMDQTGPAIACCSLGILFYNKDCCTRKPGSRPFTNQNSRPDAT